MSSTSNPQCIYKYKDGSVVPASSLDHVVAFKGTKVEVFFHSFLDGTLITPENREAFYNQVHCNIENKLYPTTDHMFIRLIVHGYTFLYVSLDNSVRANQNGFSLKNRLPELCRAISKFIKESGGEGIVFFSESCRPSFDGGMNDRTGELSWETISRFIADVCDLKYLGCNPNNDRDKMSFGMSVFSTPGYRDKIYCVLTERILTEGFGSATIGIKMIDSTTVWGIHFPIDFKGTGSENLCAKAMVGLCSLMDEHLGSVAFGDFNTIHGEMDTAIRANVSDDKVFLGDDVTFLGSFYDTVKTDEEWVSV